METQKKEVPDQPITDQPKTPQWTPPTSPTFGGRERFTLFIERFGFPVASITTLLILAVLFINTDLLLREPDKPANRSVVAEQPTPPEAQTTPAQTATPPAEPSDSTTATAIPLSLTTSPAGAAVYIDDTLVGESPLAAVALAEGARRIRIQMAGYVQLDTVVTLTETSASFQFALQEEESLIAEASEESPSATDAEESAPTSTPNETPATSPVVEDTPPVQPESSPETVSSDDRQQPSSDTEEQPAETEEAPPVVEEEPVPQVGEVYFVSEPAGATVLLAGQRVGVTPFVLSELQPGRRQVTMRLDGYKDFTTTVRVVVQERRSVNGRLEKIVSTLGTLRILVKPWGNIYIDDKLHKAESNIWYTTKLSPGTYRVRVEHPNLGIWSQDVTLVAGEERTIDYDFKPKK